MTSSEIREVKQAMKNTFLGVEVETAVSMPAAKNIVEKVLIKKYGKVVVEEPKDSKDHAELCKYNKYKIHYNIGGKPCTFYIDYDSTITGKPKPTGAEIVTPKMKYDQLPDLLDVLGVMQKNGMTVTPNCSVHVHVDGDGLYSKQVCRLNTIKKMFFDVYVNQDILYKMFNMQSHKMPLGDVNFPHGNVYLQEELAARIKSAKTKDELLAAWYNDETEMQKTPDVWPRYRAINFHSLFNKGTVEYRLFNSPPDLDPLTVKAYVDFVLAQSSCGRLDIQIPPMLEKGKSKHECVQKYLLNIGLTGEEFETTRKILTSQISHTEMVQDDEYRKYMETYNRFAHKNKNLKTFAAAPKCLKSAQPSKAM